MVTTLGRALDLNRVQRILRGLHKVFSYLQEKKFTFVELKPRKCGLIYLVDVPSQRGDCFAILIALWGYWLVHRRVGSASDQLQWNATEKHTTDIGM